MNRLAAALATIVRSRLDQAMADEGAEVRLIFHGPPLEILRDVFDMLVDGSGHDGPPVPILLQVPSLAMGQVNPAVGASGHCDETHLLVLRNSPARPTYVALVPPGQHSNKSVSTTTDEFGMLAANNAGNVPFEDWWADEFLQELVGIGIAQVGIPEESREGARALVEHAASACDEVDRDRTQRASAWRAVSRVFSAYPVGDDLSPASRLSLACGLPPMQSGGLSPREQVSTLEKVADALADGFNAGVARAQELSADEDIAILGDFLAHLRVACDRPTAFERAASAYYAPASGLVVAPAPVWWTSLTVEKWSELLAEEASATGDIIMVCSNGIVPLGKGMPVLVEEQVELQFETVGLDASNAVVTIERTPSGPSGKEVGQVRADSGRTFRDVAPPVHRTPMRYVASAEHFKPGAIKVISLATWAPGIFVACRLARKLTPPKRRKGKGSPEYEASLLLPGAGRYELLLFCSPGISLDETAAGNPDDAAERGDAASTLAVRSIRPRLYQVEVELDGNYQLDIGFEREAPEGTVSREACRVFLSVEEVQQQGCRSEFERLIRANRRVLQPAEARAIVQLNRNARSSSLQDWMLSADLAARSYMPVIIAEDYVGSWVQPSWSDANGPVFSSDVVDGSPSPRSRSNLLR